MLVFGEVSRFDCSEAAGDDRRQWVNDNGPTSPSKTTTTETRIEAFGQTSGCAHIELGNRLSGVPEQRGDTPDK